MDLDIQCTVSAPAFGRLRRLEPPFNSSLLMLTLNRGHPHSPLPLSLPYRQPFQWLAENALSVITSREFLFEYVNGASVLRRVSTFSVIIAQHP